MAAATVLAAVGAAVGLSFRSAPAVGEVGKLGAAGHSAAVRSAGHAPARTADAAAKPEPSRTQATPTGKAAHTKPATRPAPPTGPIKPYLIYDSVTPYAIPAGKIVATYATGPGAPPASEVAGRQQVVWIDVTGTDYSAAVLDVEPGNALPSAAGSWAYHKLSADPTSVAVIYTAISEWPSVQASVATLPSWMQSHIHWWIADPTGVPHIVPGSQATQWYWGSSYDISTATPGFLHAGS